jgi:hypothetical protein
VPDPPSPERRLNWLWLLVAIPFAVILLPRRVALFVFPVVILASMIGMLYFGRKALKGPGK